MMHNPYVLTKVMTFVSLIWVSYVRNTYSMEVLFCLIGVDVPIIKHPHINVFQNVKKLRNHMYIQTFDVCT
jgi:hypothetical protein